MPPHMIAIVPFLTTAHHIRHLQISVPLVACLLDGRKYFRSDEAPPPAGQEPAKPKPPPDKPGRRWR